MANVRNREQLAQIHRVGEVVQRIGRDPLDFSDLELMLRFDSPSLLARVLAAMKEMVGTNAHRAGVVLRYQLEVMKHFLLVARVYSQLRENRPSSKSLAHKDSAAQEATCVGVATVSGPALRELRTRLTGVRDSKLRRRLASLDKIMPLDSLARLLGEALPLHTDKGKKGEIAALLHLVLTEAPKVRPIEYFHRRKIASILEAELRVHRASTNAALYEDVEITLVHALIATDARSTPRRQPSAGSSGVRPCKGRRAQSGGR